MQEIQRELDVANEDHAAKSEISISCGSWSTALRTRSPEDFSCVLVVLAVRLVVFFRLTYISLLIYRYV